MKNMKNYEIKQFRYETFIIAKTTKILANCCIKIRNLRHFLFFQVILIKFVLWVSQYWIFKLRNHSNYELLAVCEPGGS